MSSVLEMLKATIYVLTFSAEGNCYFFFALMGQAIQHFVWRLTKDKRKDLLSISKKAIVNDPESETKLEG